MNIGADVMVAAGHQGSDLIGIDSFFEVIEDFNAPFESSPRILIFENDEYVVAGEHDDPHSQVMQCGDGGGGGLAGCVGQGDHGDRAGTGADENQGRYGRKRFGIYQNHRKAIIKNRKLRNHRVLLYMMSQ